MSLLELCTKVVRLGEQLGASGVEAYATKSREVEVTLQDNHFQLGKAHLKAGLGVRILLGHRSGFASTNILTQDSIAEAVAVALKLARMAPEDEGNQLPAATKPAQVPGLYDEAAEDFTPSDAVAQAQALLEAARGFDGRVSVSSGGFNVSIQEVGVANSLGVGCEERASLFQWLVMGMAVEGDAVSTFDYQFGATHQLDEIDVTSTARRMAKNVVASLRPRKCEPFIGTLILAPGAGKDLLVDPLALAANGRNIYRGFSRLRDHIGEAVASRALTLIDDATQTAGIAASSFDREGVGRRPLALIERGVLKAYLYNTYYAAKMGTKSTGHASGGPRNPPSIRESNLLVAPGRRSLQDLVSEVERGLLVTRFSGNINYVSGDFSGTVKAGHLIERGELKHPVRETMVAGNLYKLLHRLSALTREREWFFNTLLPYIRVEEVSITSG